MAGHVALLGEERGACRVLVGRPKEKGHLEDLDINEKETIKCIIKKGMRGCMDWIDLTHDMNT